ncbi:ribosomal protein S20 [Synechococcus sp. PCC 7502]|uniref:30S ribosomal protein S20 n=1 Tax=Synechococcus sp. PCC 7502 TaxID=1173263 RepID=UPI00029FE4D5|nr:30S ribosomal protein S20 [Synechococcus sp. PCC 7502]AFY73038.1 ribosomal protein S20 [Synechococcus sp. PCC 7502]
MANIKSSAKRAQISERNRLRNKSYKSAVKTLMKKYFDAVNNYQTAPGEESLETANTKLSLAFSKIDKAVKNGILHPNNGARKKARLAKALKAVQPQPVS